MEIMPATVMKRPLDSSQPGEVTLKVDLVDLYRAPYHDVPKHGHWGWRMDLHRTVSALEAENAAQAQAEAEAATQEAVNEGKAAEPELPKAGPVQESKLQKTGRK